ncbi:tetratricopeptide repeat protein, partial [Skermania piniformis]
MRLNGAAAYAHRFAEWALGWGVPADNVWLACSWPSDTAIPSSPARQLQPTFTGIQDLLADAAEFDADLLLLYWCGHGVLNIQRERTLFTADARAGVRRQHNVSDIQQYLSSTTVRRLDRQIIVVDACANFYADLNLDEALPGGTLNTGRPRHVNHYQLFSASQGQIAEHDPVTGTTLFSELVLEWLAAADPTALPDVNELTAHVSAEFARSDLRQRPTTFVLRHSHGENRDWSYAGGVLGGAAPQIVVGAIPAAPAALVVRPAADALARQVREAPVVAVVTGLRGVGKSQLAAELARSRVADGCGLVLWLNAEESDGLLADLAAAADALGVADPEGDSTKSARRLRDTLSARREPGLLVFDNATDPDRLRAFLPVAGPVRVVITSTDQTFAELGKRLPLDVFHRDESVDYLARVTGLEDPSGADALAIELGDLPLALAVAAAAIAGPSWGWGGYRDYLAELRAYPLDETLRRRVGSDYPRSVVQAVLLSRSKCIAGTADPALDRDTESDQLTGRVLETLAMLSPDGVPPDFLTPLAGQQPAKRQLRRAIERCVTASLVSWSGDRELLLMHRLVGRVLREQAVADDSVGRVAGAALELLTDRLFDHREAWQRRAEGEQLLAQIEAIWATGVYTDPDPTADASVAAVLDARSWAVRHLMERADLARAIPLGEVVLSDRVRVLGADHPSTLTSRHNLAGAYESAGRVGEAIDLFEVVLSDSVRVLGADHPSTLVSRHNLAGAY